MAQKTKKMQCKHDWVKIINIYKEKFWMAIIYENRVQRNEKYVCLNCGLERR